MTVSTRSSNTANGSSKITTAKAATRTISAAEQAALPIDELAEVVLQGSARPNISQMKRLAEAVLVLSAARPRLEDYAPPKIEKSSSKKKNKLTAKSGKEKKKKKSKKSSKAALAKIPKSKQVQ